MLRVFENNDTKLQCIMQGETLYFKAKEVAAALGYERPKDAIKVHVRDKYKVRLGELRMEVNRLPSNSHPHSLYVTESGLYQLIFSSKMAKAEEFQDWVLEEVLPALRKTGRYAMDKRFDSPNKKVFKIENEADLHAKVVDYMRRFYPEFIITPGLGELQDSDSKRITCWRKGYQAGQPDLLILNAHKKYRGLCIELKTPKGNGVLSAKQSKKIAQLDVNGYLTMVSNDYDVICRALSDYADGIRIPCKGCIKRFKSYDTLKTHLKIFHRYNEAQLNSLA